MPRRAGKGRGESKRLVYFGKAGLVETRVYERDALPASFGGVGPAVIEEYGSTTLIWPGDRFKIGAMSEIRIDCRGGEERP